MFREWTCNLCIIVIKYHNVSTQLLLMLREEDLFESFFRGEIRGAHFNPMITACRIRIYVSGKILLPFSDIYTSIYVNYTKFHPLPLTSEHQLEVVK